MTQAYWSLTRLSGKVKKQLMESAHLKITVAQNMPKEIAEMAKQIYWHIKNDQKIYIFGNGGSAADAQHFAGELVGKCRIERVPLPVIALTTNSSILSALSNDFGFSEIFARQIEALGKDGDLAIGISTSGNSKNVIRGLEAAKEIGLNTIGLLGNNGGTIKDLVDFRIIIPSNDVLRIQEVHITILHIVADLIEQFVSLDT